jgi:hypothetical protein
MERSLHHHAGDRSFKREFRRQLRLLIIITLGFTIAFTWRQTIFDLSLNFISYLTNITNNSELDILASTLITAVSLIVIYITAHILKDRVEYY